MGASPKTDDRGERAPDANPKIDNRGAPAGRGNRRDGDVGGKPEIGADIHLGGPDPGIQVFCSRSLAQEEARSLVLAQGPVRRCDLRAPFHVHQARRALIPAADLSRKDTGRADRSCGGGGYFLAPPGPVLPKPPSPRREAPAAKAR